MRCDLVSNASFCWSLNCTFYRDHVTLDICIRHACYLYTCNAMQTISPVIQCCTDHKSPRYRTPFLVTFVPSDHMHVPLPIDFPSCDMVCLPLSPQSLQLPQHNHIRIQESVHTLPHTWLLVFIQFAVLNGPRGDALAETCVGQGVYGYIDHATG